MRRLAPFFFLGVGACLLFFRLGRPALWQDESETALRAVSILETGLPRTALNGVRVTAQPSLSIYEGNAAGVWTWNTWLPAYLTAFSFSVLGRTPFAARLPFAVAGLLTLWLAWRLFQDAERERGAEGSGAAEAGLALLALSPAFLLFARQSRYYALTALGSVLVLSAWRRLIAGRSWGVLAVVASLQILLHSSFAFFAIAVMALMTDAVLRRDENLRRRFFAVAGWTAVLSVPTFFYFRIWNRPGNHLYGLGESFEFLKTFLLWLSLFSVSPVLLAAMAERKRRLPFVVVGFFLLCGLVSEGFFSRAAAAFSFAWIGAHAVRAPADFRRVCWLWLASTLALLSVSAAEPYGRYLMGVFPPLAYLGGRWISDLVDRRFAPALAAALAATNWAGGIAVKAAGRIAAPSAPAESVSGMMRHRLRAVGPRSDLARFVGELARGPEGYVERAIAVIKAGGGGSVFSDADALSLMFAGGFRPVYPDELASTMPDWLLLSPWLRLDPKTSAEVWRLIAAGRYEPVPVEAPGLLWQNNPDPLFRDFAPRSAPLFLFRRRR